MIYVMSGGGKTFAAIGVTYPEGSELICTDGTKTLKAKTTSGQWVFSIPKEGTWTVTSTQGSNSASKTITISDEGQCEKIILAYEFVLFSSAGLASGYSVQDNYITPAIDLSKFSSLEIIYSNKGNIVFGLDTDPANVNLQRPPVLYGNANVVTNATFSIDLTNYQDQSLYFGAWGHYSGTPYDPEIVDLAVNNKILDCKYNGLDASLFGIQITSIKFKN